MQAPGYDYVVIGSGFGGSASALRLSEKGYRVLVVEKGRWYRTEDFPKSNWNLRRWLWLPSLRFFGFFKISFFRHVGVVSGVGVGGGSLTYANTLPVPKPEFFNTGSWAKLADWTAELAPFYRLARLMLGTARNPRIDIGDQALHQLARELDREEHFERTEVAVYFGEPELTVPDPYFGGRGPDRAGCNFCGGCMTGCRFNAKNTLDKNYLHLAQLLGVEIWAEREVVDVVPFGKPDGSEGYTVRVRSSTNRLAARQSVTTRGVVFAGGVLGSVSLLLRLKKNSLPRLSDRVGCDIRTNNESLIGVTTLDRKSDFSTGLAISSILSTDADSHLEPVRYHRGSGFWRLGMMPMVSGGAVLSRLGNILFDWLSHPRQNLKCFFTDDWARRTQILLFMQHLDSKIRFRHHTMRGMYSAITEGERPTSFIPRAKQLAEHFGRLVHGKPYVLFTEPLFGIPTTAHILGGAPMGADPSTGVIDSENRVFGYHNMLVCDGAAISANPGVNPSLTITAIAERAMSKIPPKSDTWSSIASDSNPSMETQPTRISV
jgi:cholesterol oxidase